VFDKVQVAMDTYAAHRFQAGPQQCACGQAFPATLTGVTEHRRHRFEVTLEAVDAAEPFCNECNGPYDGPGYEWLMEQYGGHWDTCPHRAKALPPKS
jgi:hypothetical protein